jgi:hypothetical protein
MTEQGGCMAGEQLSSGSASCSFLRLFQKLQPERGGPMSWPAGALRQTTVLPSSTTCQVSPTLGRVGPLEGAHLDNW